MSNVRVRRLAQHTARSFGRRLAAAATRELARRGHQPEHPQHAISDPPVRAPVDRPADEAELDSLRVELVSELDRLAMQEPDCTGSFRRI